MDFEGDQICCDGLIKVDDCALDVYNGQVSCACPDCPCFICVECGDGLCGEHENYCNCPDDCLLDCRQDDFCEQGDICHPATGECVIDCRLVNCDKAKCEVCPAGEYCDFDSGLCLVEGCLNEGEVFEEFDSENLDEICCTGLVAIPMMEYEQEPTISSEFSELGIDVVRD